MAEREEQFQVSDSYKNFWYNTAAELEKTIYDEKHSPVQRCRQIFKLDLTSDIPSVQLDSNAPDANQILFHYLKSALERGMSSTWSQRALPRFSVLNSSGKAYKFAEMAYYLYDITCDNIFSDYSSATGVPLRTIAELANIGYEKSDFYDTMLAFDFAQVPQTCFLNFSEVPFSDENLRTVRKIAAGVGERRALYISRSPSHELSCQGYITVTEEIRRKLSFLVILHGKREWSFYMYGAELFRIAGRQVKATEPSFQESQAVKCLKEELDGFDFVKTKEFDLLLDALHRQKHGTSVIFSTFSTNSFQKHLDRLEQYGRARALRDFHIVKKSEDEINELTSIARIDGAFVVDLEADQKCLDSGYYPASRCSIYAGVLLDSPATSAGFIGHGSRTNSVLAFVQEAVQKAREEGGTLKIAALVFSEDGYVLPILGSNALQY